jgi:hypothetical protein
MVTAARREVLQRLLQDPVWSVRLDRVKTIEDFERLPVNFARERGIKVCVLPQ